MSSPNRYGANASKSLLVDVGNLQGENGVTFINDTAAHTGEWTALVVIADAVFTVLTCPINDGASLNAISLTAKSVLMLGRITAITLASGSVVAYKK